MWSTCHRLSPQGRESYEAEFREGAVQIVRETGKPIARVADDLGVNPGTLGNWVKRIGSETVDAVASDVIVAPAGTRHGFEVLGEDPVKLLCIESPNPESDRVGDK